MKSTLAAAIAALLLPFPAAAQWLSPAASQSYNSWRYNQRHQLEQQQRQINELQYQQRQQQGFYQTRYQCGSSFYQCN